MQANHREAAKYKKYIPRKHKRDRIDTHKKPTDTRGT